MLNWTELNQALSPIHGYDDLDRRWREGFAHEFVCRAYNFTMLEMENYIARQLGEDTRGRYTQWVIDLTRLFRLLADMGVKDILDLVEQINTREKFEGFIALSGTAIPEFIGVMKYLVFWFIPMKKPLSGVIKNDPRLNAVIVQLRLVNIRYNLDLIAAGITPQARQELAASLNVPLFDLTELVNRADFSRMPWASGATISNLVGAGYPSLSKLAATDLTQVSADFYRYGESIGKNLKFGNEIDNSHRIARLIPRVLVD